LKSLKNTVKQPRIIWAGNEILLCLLLFGLVVWVFFPSIHGAFIERNDHGFVTENTHINLTLANVVWAFGHSFDANWLPLTLWSFMLDHQLYGLKPWGYHLTNVLLHAVNTVLVFLVLRRMTGLRSEKSIGAAAPQAGATWRSLMVAVLFGLHPLRVESVAWISERKDVLSVTFWMLTLWAYAHWVQRSAVRSPQSAVGNQAASPRLLTPGFYWLALVFFALSLMSKAMMVTLPCVLLLLDYWPLERWPQKSLRALLVEKVPFFLLSAIVSAVTYITQKSADMMSSVVTGLSLSFGARLENALVSYGRYLGKLFWPVDLGALYPYPDRWPVPTILLAALLVLGLSVLVFAMRRHWPFLLTGWLWYLGTLVPVLGLVPVGAQAMADRYSYIPSIGILMILVWGTCQMTREWHYQGIGLGAAGGVLALVCIVLTRHQIGYWKDDISVWQRAVAVTGNNYDAHNMLGRAFGVRKRVDEALREFQEVVRLNPGFAEPQNTLGRAWEAKGRVNEAMACYQKALEVRPDYFVAQINLSSLLLRMGRMDEAIVHYQKALQINPDYAEAHNNLGVALASQGRLDEAIACFQKTLEINPNFAEAHYNLGYALYSKGRLDEAIACFQKTLEINPNYAEAHYNLSFALRSKGRLDEAIRELQETLRLKPDYAAASNNLVIALGLKEKLAKQPTNSFQP
jgi:tetratricopeptide (TPR) repeat protein